MSLWWSIAPLILIGGIGVLATIFTRLSRELDELDTSLVRLDRIGVGVDELRHDVGNVRAQLRRSAQLRRDAGHTSR
jgi:hypothetical protein